jgi:GNAT superfamily N-acetyltransferase
VGPAKYILATAVGRAMVRTRLRRATLSDLDLLVRHRRGMWEEILDASPQAMDAADRAYRRWARPRLKAREMVGFIVETERGEPVASGCIWLMPSQPRPLWKGTVSPYLMSMYTEPAYRGQGHATRITREAIRWSRKRGYTTLLLHASELGKAIYLREGFVEGNEMRLRLAEWSGK